MKATFIEGGLHAVGWSGGQRVSRQESIRPVSWAARGAEHRDDAGDQARRQDRAAREPCVVKGVPSTVGTRG